MNRTADTITEKSDYIQETYRVFLYEECTLAFIGNGIPGQTTRAPPPAACHPARRQGSNRRSHDCQPASPSGFWLSPISGFRFSVGRAKVPRNGVSVPIRLTFPSHISESPFQVAFPTRLAFPSRLFGPLTASMPTISASRSAARRPSGA